MKRPILLAAASSLTLLLSGPAAHGALQPAPSQAIASAQGPPKPTRPDQSRHPIIVPRPGTAPLVNNNLPLTYWGGAVALYSRTYEIIWQPQGWYLPSNFTYMMYQYMSDVGGRGLYNVNTRYYQKSYGYYYYIQNNSGWVNYYVDTTPYPANRCTNPVTGARCILDSDIQAEVRKVAGIMNWPGGTNNMFFVYTAYGEGSCYVTCGSSSAYRDYCAYHSALYNSAKASWMIYANMPYPNSGNSRYQCNSVPTTPNGDKDVDAAISLTSHEHFEAVTDPYGGISNNAYAAWQEACSGTACKAGVANGNLQGENGDKCAWTWGPFYYGLGTANQSWNGHNYLVQQEWSNKAFYAKVGNPVGCVQYG